MAEPLENLFASFTYGLTDEPRFGSFVLKDINPLSGTVKQRPIYPPNDAMRVLQRQVVGWLRGIAVPLPYSTGGQRGNSPLGNVRRHAHNRYFFLTDLKGAFENLLVGRVVQALTQIAPQLAQEAITIEAFLWRYCATPSGGIPTGSPSSTLMFNLTLGALLDENLGKYCNENNIIYTRYIDDLTFSSLALITKAQRREIRRIITSAGLVINEQKTQVLDLAKQPIVINGIGLELGGRTFVPGAYRRRLQGMLRRAIKLGDVPPDEIHGRMGAVQACLGTSSWLAFNRSEARLMSLYMTWRESQQGRPIRRTA